MKIINKILVTVVLLLLVLIIVLSMKNKRIDDSLVKSNFENTLLKSDLNATTRQLDVATDQFLLLINSYENEIKVYRSFQDSCKVLIGLNNSKTSKEINNLLNLSNEELLKLAKK